MNQESVAKQQKIWSKIWSLSLDKDAETINNLYILNLVIKDAIQDGVDFICIDSLDAAFENINTLPRKAIEHIISLPSEKNVTMLLIHHTAKNQKNYAGTRHLKNSVDFFYYLSKTNDENILALEKGGRYDEDGKIFLKRTFSKKVENGEEYVAVTYELCNEGTENKEIVKDNLLRKIQTIIEEQEKDSNLGFNDLLDLLKPFAKKEGKECYDEANIKTHLTNLEKNGLIKRYDGRTWKKNGILIL